MRGVPAGYSSAGEREWKRRIGDNVPPAPPRHAGRGVFIDLRVPRTTAQSPGFDLDNMLDPVLSAVVNTQRWFGGRRPNLHWVAGRKQMTAGPTGADIAVLGEPPELWNEQAERALDEVFDDELPSRETVGRYAEWIRKEMTRRLPRGWVGVRLKFASGAVNLGDVAEGKPKVLIDGLWPILGGRRGAPNDHRVAALVSEKGVQGLGGPVAVTVVGRFHRGPPALIAAVAAPSPRSRADTSAGSTRRVSPT